MKHTRDEVMAMDAEQLRKAIAEAKGLDRPLFEPDWPGSIADAWALEDEIPQSGWEDYVYTLRYVVAQSEATIWTDRFDDEGRMEIHPFCLINATAEQRSRAWLAWWEAQHEA